VLESSPKFAGEKKRVSQENKRIQVKAIAGTHVVLMAIDVAESARQGLRGFAIKRGVNGGAAAG